jgi:hypothetical protein
MFEFFWCPFDNDFWHCLAVWLDKSCTPTLCGLCLNQSTRAIYETSFAMYCSQTTRVVLLHDAPSAFLTSVSSTVWGNTCIVLIGPHVCWPKRTEVGGFDCYDSPNCSRHGALGAQAHRARPSCRVRRFLIIAFLLMLQSFVFLLQWCSNHYHHRNQL